MNISRILVTLLTGLCLVLPSSFLQAVELEGFYRAMVRVDSRADGRERQQAFSAAMSQVVIKVSGRTEAVNAGQIRRALNNPERYVESWVYRTVQPSNANTNLPATELIELEVNFFESEIQGLLDASNISLWPNNRPNTVVWLVMQEELGERLGLGSGSNIEAVAVNQINSMAELRGLPVLFPLMDFQDQQALSPNNIWDFNEQALLRASARYQTESILAIRLYQSLSGELLASSRYFFRGLTLTHQSFEDELAGFVETSINMAAEELSAYYSVLVSGANSSMIVKMNIEGIDTAQNYAGLINYINELAAVNAYQIASIDDQKVVLNLETGGQLRQVVETIALDRNLEPVSELRRNEDGIFLYYRWTGQ
ncbi:DUF2066 domain-containing protein [Gammaproteobacteria bacterium]|nr:DUF2066 domain-containing protein [Gammaproteobacteria bacterium]